MEIENIHKGYGRTSVRVLAVEDYSDAEVAERAMTAAGETRHSLFGWSVTRWDSNTATVSLYTD